MFMRTQKSSALYKRASGVLVGGVDSPVRAYKAVGGAPLFIRRAKGSEIQDEDGNSYIDYVCSWGALILGSAHPKVVKALRAYIPRGTSYGAPTRLEIELAELITDAMPSIDKVRFVNSGTEATMSALRLARAYTKRRKILKFEGCYHGHADSLLVKGGSGMATLGVADSAGITDTVAADTLVAPYNDIGAVKRFFDECAEDIAAVIVEPVAANMSVVPPREGFLSGLSELTRQHGALLIFDEVITGFRVAYGGAQQLYGVDPDLTCLGKIIGGGLPVGAFGGRDDIMNMVAPLGPVYQAGTLSGNPLAMSAGIANLKELRGKKAIYNRLERISARLEKGISNAAESEATTIQLNRIGSMLGLFFTDHAVVDYSSVKSSNVQEFNVFFHSMLESGIYLPPSAFETIFVSSAHTAHDISRTTDAAKLAFSKTRRKLKTVAT